MPICALPTYGGKENANLHPDSHKPEVTNLLKSAPDANVRVTRPCAAAATLRVRPIDKAKCCNALRLRFLGG